MHNATNLILKNAMIDDRIIPVIEWINSLNCYSIVCCQGENKSNHPCVSRPYVLFVCWDLKSLDHIVSVVKSFNFRHKDEDEKPVSLELKTSLVDHFALSRRLELSMVKEEILPLFCEHIKDLAKINKDTIPEDSFKLVLQEKTVKH